ncbi:tetratricopeptide repeat protein [Desulforhopalus sp. 52FAK]
MITVFLDQPIKAFSPFITRSLILCIVLLCACSCSSREEKQQESEKKIAYIEINGFKVPQMASASEQFFLAKVSDTTLPRQIALFNSVSILFPEERMQRGDTELEIAYLQLGVDYRLSSLGGQKKAAENYLQIAIRYQDIPEVAAKALWYHGWITTDLLGQKTKGIISYNTIIEQYKSQPVTHPPYVPWTSINLSQSPDVSDQSSPQAPLTWGEMTYLELIRHGQSAAISLGHYTSLHQHAAKSSVIPSALKLLANRDDLTPADITIIQKEIAQTELGQNELNELTALLLKKQEQRR